MAHFLLTIMLRVVILLLVTLCSATNNKNTSKPRDHRYFPCCGGQPATNGLPGMHGMPGSPGAPGRDGRDGAKGGPGSPGKTGPQGPRGVDGKKGAKGEPGIQGPAGQKGQRGDKGDSGTPGLSSHMNWKDCTWKKVDHRDSGEIYVCEFMKNYTDTTLHVYFTGNLRVGFCDRCCSRWYFTFNGAECSYPGSIDGAFYMRNGRNHNIHRHHHIEGHCNNIHKGKVRLGFWVGKCITGQKSADADTGWHSMSRIFIEEVPKAQQ